VVEAAVHPFTEELMKMKRIPIIFLAIVLLSSLVVAKDKNTFLLEEKAKYQAQLADLEKAKSDLENDQKYIERLAEDLPNLLTLIADVQDADLRGDWIELRDQWTAEIEGWERDIAGWDERIAVAQDKIAEIDRLLALP
jgi:chromosome segregation ATPase